jgi:hypothetical protein
MQIDNKLENRRAEDGVVAFPLFLITDTCRHFLGNAS